MMKITIFALAAISLVCALPQQSEPPQGQGQPPVGQGQPPVEIVKQDSEVNVDGYNFEFETSDGTVREEHGEYKNDTDQQGLLVKGSYRYVAPDGQHVSVTYVADKNGYQPSEHTGDDAQKPAAPQS